jgi:hypothetical protein
MMTPPVVDSVKNPGVSAQADTPTTETDILIILC